VADLHVYVNLKKLDHVSGVEVDSPGNVVAVSFEGGKAEQEAIERAVEETGYELSRLSVRTTFPEERSLWDI
jgi:copper chaperone CopZ